MDLTTGLGESKHIEGVPETAADLAVALAPVLQLLRGHWSRADQFRSGRSLTMGTVRRAGAGWMKPLFECCAT